MTRVRDEGHVRAAAAANRVAPHGEYPIADATRKAKLARATAITLSDRRLFLRSEECNLQSISGLTFLDFSFDESYLEISSRWKKDTLS
jgi:hypothetical protein